MSEQEFGRSVSHRERDGQSRMILLLLALVLLGILAAYILIPLISPSVMTSNPQQSRQEQENAESAQPRHPMRGPDRGVAGEEPAPSQPRWTEMHEAPAADGFTTVRVECQTPDGKPMAGVAVLCTVQAPEKAFKTKEWYSSESVYTTGADGGFEIRANSTYLLALRADAGENYSQEMFTDFSMARTIVIEIQPVATVRIGILYDDGSPFQGSASLVGLDFGSAKSSRTYIRHFKCDQFGVATLKSVPVGHPLQCRVASNMMKVGYAGYEDYLARLDLNDLVSGRELLVVVPKAAFPLGMIRVEFGDNGPDRGSTIVLQGKLLPPSKSGLSAGCSFWYSGALQPMDYRVFVLGPRAWQSDWFAVKGGLETVVRAELRPGGAVRARLMDGNGKPLHRATLKIQDGGYFSSARGAPRPEITEANGWSDADGVVTLGGLPASKISIECNAIGKEPVTQDVQIMAEGTTDLGDIVLPDAIGEIKVELVGTSPGVEYALVVFQPSGSEVYPFIAINGSTATVSGLPLREYRVGITGKRGGSIVGEFVTLTKDRPRQALTLDVSSVKPD